MLNFRFEHKYTKMIRTITEVDNLAEACKKGNIDLSYWTCIEVEKN